MADNSCEAYQKLDTLTWKNLEDKYKVRLGQQVQKLWEK